MASESSSRPQLRKTRFVCVSDTHNQTPRLPAGDVLVHAGDLSNQGSLSELQKTVAWLEKADFEAKIVVAGNHDITLDKAFFCKHGASWRFPKPQDPDECLRLLLGSPSITYLQHESTSIYLQSPTGPHTHFKVFGSPYSPEESTWAFQYTEAEASKQWEEIPLDTDIVVTHTPPRMHCDADGRGTALGCESFRRALWRVRPRLAICGHVHGGRGAECVKWKLDDQESYLEEATELWKDPGSGNRKQSLIDLTAKGRMCIEDGGLSPRRNLAALGLHSAQQSKDGNMSDAGGLMFPEADRGNPGGGKYLSRAKEIASGWSASSSRKETCVINAAVMAGNWRQGPKRFNKPIIVDIDLPVWT